MDKSLVSSSSGDISREINVTVSPFHIAMAARFSAIRDFPKPVFAARVVCHPLAKPDCPPAPIHASFQILNGVGTESTGRCFSIRN
jgi:hypothetical protein